MKNNIDWTKLSDEDLHEVWYNTSLETEIGIQADKEHKRRVEGKEDEVKKRKAEKVQQILNKYRV